MNDCTNPLRRTEPTRRQFLQTSAALGAAALAGSGWTRRARAQAGEQLPEPSAAELPRWRGFNLMEKFVVRNNEPFREKDFEWIRELGFNFIRLPMDYRCWTEGEDWTRLREDQLKEIDQAVEWGEKHGLHVSINFHRIPGYCVNPPDEPLDLWTNPEAQRVAELHWSTFAKRYQGRPNRNLSFDLVNEPANVDEPTYVKTARGLIQAIREQDPGRLIISDGLQWGRDPIHGLVDDKVAQSTRGYDPMRISHHRASWIDGSQDWPEPTWPLKLSEDDVWDKQRLRTDVIQPWQELAQKGVGVHVGEWGCWRDTPHDVALAWMSDFLDLWRQVGWGWAMWNFRGGFGILDSGREDVAYESWRGHHLDRKMLEMLQADAA